MTEYTVKVSKDGDREWCLQGELHREDGPAVELANGDRSWWLHGENLSEDEHRARTTPAQEMTIAEIEAALGHRVKVVKS